MVTQLLLAVSAVALGAFAFWFGWDSLKNPPTELPPSGWVHRHGDLEQQPTDYPGAVRAKIHAWSAMIGGGVLMILGFVSGIRMII